MTLIAAIALFCANYSEVNSIYPSKASCQKFMVKCVYASNLDLPKEWDLPLCAKEWVKK